MAGSIRTCLCCECQLQRDPGGPFQNRDSEKMRLLGLLARGCSFSEMFFLCLPSGIGAAGAIRTLKEQKCENACALLSHVLSHWLDFELLKYK